MEKSTWGIDERHPSEGSTTADLVLRGTPSITSTVRLPTRRGAFGWGCFHFRWRTIVRLSAEPETVSGRKSIALESYRSCGPTRQVAPSRLFHWRKPRLRQPPRFAAEGGRARVVRRSQGYLIGGDRPSGTPSAFGIGWQAHPGLRNATASRVLPGGDRCSERRRAVVRKRGGVQFLQEGLAEMSVLSVQKLDSSPFSVGC